MSLRAFFTDLLLGGACYVKTGSATPEAAVTAGIGSLYLRTTSGSPTLYTKETGSGNTGWVEAGFMKRSITTLTDAQIKALPTTPVTLVAAPSSGVRVFPFFATVHANTTSGAYTNINVTYSALEFSHPGSGYWALTPIANDTASLAKMTALLGATNNSHVTLPPYMEGYDAGAVALAGEWNLAMAGDSGQLDGVALEVRIDNNASGNLTGGHANNVMTIVTYYTTEAAG